MSSVTIVLIVTHKRHPKSSLVTDFSSHILDVTFRSVPLHSTQLTHNVLRVTIVLIVTRRRHPKSSLVADFSSHILTDDLTLKTDRHNSHEFSWRVNRLSRSSSIHKVVSEQHFGQAFQLCGIFSMCVRLLFLISQHA